MSTEIPNCAGHVRRGYQHDLLDGSHIRPCGQALGFDLVWFGVVVVMVVEISLITPPIGLNVFVLKSMLPDVPLSSIYRGIMPFFAADIVRLLLVIIFPPIVLFLPQLMGP